MSFRAGWSGGRWRGFNPHTDPALIEGWDCYGTPLPNGVIATWTGVKGTVAAMSGAAVTADSLGIYDDAGGQHPGVALSGSLMTAPVGPLITGKTRIAIVASLANFTAPLALFYELGDDWTAGNGRFACALNIAAPSAADFNAAARGGGANGTWQSPGLAMPVSPAPPTAGSPFSITHVFDLGNALGSTSRRIDNVEILGGTSTPGVVAGSTFANLDLHIGARTGVLFPASIYLQQFWILDNPDERTLTNYARYADAGVGEVGA